MNRTAIICTTIATLGLLGAAALVTAGPLDPPAGPVAQTFKTLAEVEPRIAINSTNTPGDADSLYKITQPGSYYLTGNITGVSGKHGIEIASSDVVIDLSGFQLLGVSGSLDGVSDTFGATNVQIRNGSFRDWRDEGVDCINSESAIISDVNVRNCAGVGFAVGRYGIVSRCSSASNGGGGISTTFECVVSNCTVELNAIGGIITTTGCRVVDCAASNNAGSGISVGTGSTVSGCAASDGGAHGINAADGCTIADCSAYRNAQSGIIAADGATVTSCSVRSNSQDGIQLDDGGTIIGCTAESNGQRGISAAFGCTISQCTSYFNGTHGVEVSGGGCTIAGNSCASNGRMTTDGAGIFVNGSQNVIRDNVCTASDIGININSGTSLVVRNVCGQNTTNWLISLGNNYGPIINRIGLPTLPVNGSSAASTLTTTDPNANFSL